jgi:hypothetical protein
MTSSGFIAVRPTKFCNQDNLECGTDFIAQYTEADLIKNNNSLAVIQDYHGVIPKIVIWCCRAAVPAQILTFSALQVINKAYRADELGT